MTRTPEIDQLVVEARDGSRSAFDELVRATYDDTYTLAHRLTGNEEDTRDVVQDAYLRAFRGIRQFRGDAQFSTWMYRITANCAATHMGRRRRHQHDELDEDAPVIDTRAEVDPQARAEASATRDQLEAALAELPRGCVPSSCCATSTTFLTSPSRPSSGSRRRQRRYGCTEPVVASASACTAVPARGQPVRCEALSELLAEAAEGRPVQGRSARVPCRALSAVPGRPGAVPPAAPGAAIAGRSACDDAGRLGGGGARCARRAVGRLDGRTGVAPGRGARRDGRGDGGGGGQRHRPEHSISSPAGWVIARLSRGLPGRSRARPC